MAASKAAALTGVRVRLPLRVLARAGRRPPPPIPEEHMPHPLSPVLRRLVPAVLIAAAAALGLSAPAQAAEPKLTVAPAKLAAALQCTEDVDHATRTPVMLVTGTGASGDEAYAIGKPALDAYGAPVCCVDFPRLHHGGRPGLGAVPGRRAARHVAARRAQGRRLRDQPGRAAAAHRADLLAEPAREGLRRHRRRRHPARDDGRAGSRAAGANGCIPAGWQQAEGSQFLRALNASRTRRPARPPGRRCARDRRDRAAADRRAPDLRAEGRDERPDPGVCPAAR